MARTRVMRWEVTDHGVTGSQYFQGHGISGKQFDDCATGYGSTAGEALNDALESLAQNDWEITERQEQEMREELTETSMTVCDTCEHDEDCDFAMSDACERYYYVSVDVARWTTPGPSDSYVSVIEGKPGARVLRVEMMGDSYSVVLVIEGREVVMTADEFETQYKPED